MLDSDSDEDLIPTVDKFKDIFAKATKEARRDPHIKPANVSNKSSKESSKPKAKALKEIDDEEIVEVPVQTKKFKFNKTSGKASKKDVSLSEDTQDLLAQVDKLTEAFPKRVPTIMSSIANSELYSDIKNHQLENIAATSKRGRGGRRSSRGRGRGRGRRGKQKEVEDIVMVDDDFDIEDVLDSSVASNLAGDEILEVHPDDICRILLRWKGEIQKFQYTKGTKFSKVRMEFANKVSMRADNIVFMYDTAEEIPDNESVEKIKFGTVLDVFVRMQAKPTGNNNKNVALDPDSIRVQVQGSGGHRERMTIVIKRTTLIQQLVEDYIEKFMLQGKEFKLIFDGDVVDLSETPESLDLDGGEMFDIVEIKAK